MDPGWAGLEAAGRMAGSAGRQLRTGYGGERGSSPRRTPAAVTHDFHNTEFPQFLYRAWYLLTSLVLLLLSARRIVRAEVGARARIILCCEGLRRLFRRIQSARKLTYPCVGQLISRADVLV